MYLIIATVTIVGFGLMTLAGATPLRISREAYPPSSSSSITVIQTPQTDSSAGTTRTTTTLNECISLQNSHVQVPTKVEVEPPSGSYQMIGYTEDCDQRDETKGIPIEIQNSIALVNKRTPVCSFKLGRRPSEKLTIRFSGLLASYTVHLKDTKECIDICGSLNNSWARYAKKVELLEEDGRVANNHIEIFKDNRCNRKISDVDETVNLVEVTTTRTEPQIKSFVIFE